MAAPYPVRREDKNPESDVNKIREHDLNQAGREKRMTRISSIALFVVFLLASSSAKAGENCSLLSGTCRDACGQTEEAQRGAFEDCGEKQECCLAKDPAGDRIACCIYSFAAANYGPLNCGLPAGKLCPKGSGSPLACEKLKMCKK